MAKSCPPGSVDLKLFSWRTQQFFKVQPEFRELRRILVGIGGRETAPPLHRDPMIAFMIDCGIIFNGPIVLKPPKSGEPLTNLARVWRRRRSAGLVAIGLGYALEENGLWREHTFGILRDGVLEMEAPKQKYFGLMLIGEAADGFISGVLGDKQNPNGNELYDRQ